MVEEADVSIEGMRKANRIVAGVLEILVKEISPGIDTRALDEMAEEYIRSRGATPAFKGYRGYPATLTVSINEQVVHGIPSKEQLVKPGDLVSIDVGSCYDGCYGDSALTVGVEPVSSPANKLLEVTRRALYKGINKVQVGNRLGTVCNTIESFVKPHGFGVVRKWAGHFIGHKMHLEPRIPNYGPVDWGPKLKEGMYLAIEPMVNLGGNETEVLPDGWTVVTKDGSLSAHFEHTVAVTGEGPKILSKRENEVLM